MDILLVSKAKKGNTDAFCKLIDLHMNSMYKVAKAYMHNEEDVADAIQETILTCYEKLRTLEKDKFFKTWLTRILINKCKNMLQVNKRMVATGEFPEGVFYEKGYESMEWYEILKTLDEKYRTILLLYYLEGFNTREISMILEMKESTVKSQLKRGREKISVQYDYFKKEDVKCGHHSKGMNIL